MPSATDFNAAVQSPALMHASLGDVRNGRLVLRNGLPRPISGNFAVVYQTEVGARKFALRCFLKPASDQRERYRAIRAHLDAHPSEHFVGFAYHDEGLRVNGRWEPLMVMEWRSGERLDEHVERLLGDSAALLDLSAAWIDLFERLRGMRVAHGDVHSENIIVDGGRLVLIDYDAMYVPALAGKRIQEGGQRNFQHPRRGADDYGPTMDHFPSWVVYFTLLMLSVDASLWKTFDGGDQALLFRAEDFEKPDASALFRLLRQSDIAIFNVIERTLSDYLGRAVNDIPPLSRVTVAAGGFPLPPQPATWWVTPATPSDWWRDHGGSPERKKAWPPKK